jgi:cell wall-associated NlpC family hydrolase
MGRLVEAARTWLGVRYRHRGRSRVGVDCAGLPWVAYRDCGIELPDYRLYGRTPHDDGLVTHMVAALGEPLAAGWQLQDGDVIVSRFVNDPHHVGIIAEANYGGTLALNVIHADGQAGRVLEQRLTPDAIVRITHVFRKGVQ